MNRIVHHQLHKATITIGLQKSYSDELYFVEEVLQHLQVLQDTLIEEKGAYLGANCYHSVLVLSGQREPHLNLQFIDYPKFPLDEDSFKKAVEWIAGRLMQQLHQNRLVIQFHDSTIMLEETLAIDPRIKTTQ